MTTMPATQTYTKQVGERELEFSRIFSELGVSPTIFSVIAVGNVYHMTSELYPISLSDYYINGNDIEIYRAKINALVDIIHYNGIIHGDLHLGNIVINPADNDVKIIDFGHSYYISEIDKNTINEVLADDVLADADIIREHARIHRQVCSIQ